MGLSAYLPTIPPPPRTDLQPLPGTIPLTPQAAALPPLLYYLALILLPPFPESSTATSKTLQRLIIPLIRNTLALSSAILFFRLPLAYHVPFSIGLTYQLSLVGLYGGARVLDAFFVSLYGFGYLPRRVRYHHAPRDEDEDGDVIEEKSHATNITTANNNDKPPVRRKKPHRSQSQSYFSLHFLQTAGLGSPVTETATTHTTHHPNQPSSSSKSNSTYPSPDSLPDRLSWALEFLLAMRGAGFTWTSADVRHTKRTWRPSPLDRLHSIAVHVLPVLLLSWAVVRDVWVHYLLPYQQNRLHQAGLASGGGAEGEGDGEGYGDAFDAALPLPLQLALTGALGAFLMCAFSLCYSLAAIACHSLEPHPLAFFPPLYSARVWEVQSVRGFWAYGWHRLFSRLFLVWGVWPGQWVQRTLLKFLGERKRGEGKGEGEGDADVGKVMGGFICSAFVHAFAGHAVLGGWSHGAGGEAVFFVENGVAVVVEEGVKMVVRRWRKGKGGDGKGVQEMWYDGVIGRVWWISVLLWTGRNFARGWVKAGLVAEIAGG